MKVTYDPTADAAYIYLKERSKVARTQFVNDDVYIDFDNKNKILGIEILGASEKISSKDFARLAKMGIPLTIYKETIVN